MVAGLGGGVLLSLNPFSSNDEITTPVSSSLSAQNNETMEVEIILPEEKENISITVNAPNVDIVIGNNNNITKTINQSSPEIEKQIMDFLAQKEENDTEIISSIKQIVSILLENQLYTEEEIDDNLLEQYYYLFMCNGATQKRGPIDEPKTNNEILQIYDEFCRE